MWIGFREFRELRGDPGVRAARRPRGRRGGWWRPRPGLAWQWQLTGRLDTSVDVPVYDIDGFHHSKETVDALHRDGRKVVCYLSTGAWEDFARTRTTSRGR